MARLVGPETALVLAGGLGSRLRPEIADRPKVLAPVGKRPFLAYILDQLEASGLKRVILCTGYCGDQVEQVIGPRHGELEIFYSRETSPLGTGGALRLAAEDLDEQLLLALNGDSFCRTNLPGYFRWFQQSHTRTAMVLASVPDASRYGLVRLTENGRVDQFIEKAKSNEGPGLINAGIYLFSRRQLELIPPGVPISLEREVLPAWVDQGLAGWPGGDDFIDIGTPDSFRRAREFFCREVVG